MASSPTRQRSALAPLVVVTAVSLAVFAATARAVSDRTVPDWERSAFEWVNGWPAWTGVLEIPMQLGSLALLPAVAIVAAFAWRRPAPVAALVVAEVVARIAAGAAKAVTERPRPAELVTATRLRDPAEGFGFPSGHAAVATAGAVVVAALVPPRWRWAPLLVAALAGLARVVVGVHLPLDVLGGAALGAAIGAMAVAAPGVRSRA